MIKKLEEKTRKNELLDACLNGNGGDLFREIKSMRNTKQAVATSIDGVTEDIPDHFRNIYSKLYNSAEDTENMARVSNTVEDKVNDISLEDVLLVTPRVVKTAIGKLKSGKSDPVCSFSSDCIKVNSCQS